ncbi:MAG TPA: ABC transporter permease subunit [Thermoanaerobaculia bacterium]|nr:ABC transporter permease subunit [Thermoanaerobaculia bacterium]
MNRETWIVWKTEAKDTLRDRRALAAALLYALFGPLAMGLALAALARATPPEGPFDLFVAGAERAPGLAAFLARERVKVVVAPADARAQVRAGTLDVAVAIDPAYANDLKRFRPGRIELIWDDARGKSRRAAERARSLLERYAATERNRRLLARGVVPSSVAPILILDRDFATPAARAGGALAMLPIFLMLAPFVGATSAAIDATAGERERGSLEALLLLPVGRGALAAGKLLAAALPAAAALGLTLLGARWVLGSAAVQALDLAVGLDLGRLAALAGLLVPLALLAPATQVLAALFARTFKEAQGYISQLLLVPMVPGFLLAFGSVEVRPWMRAIPLLGHQIFAGEILAGKPPGLPELATLALATIGAAALCGFATARSFDRERLLRATGDR